MARINSVSKLMETTTNKVFFLNLARTLGEMGDLFADMRQHCALDTLIKDMIVFCDRECEPKKVMSRFAVNMTPIGKAYNELLKVLYNGPSAKSLT